MALSVSTKMQILVLYSTGIDASLDLSVGVAFTTFRVFFLFDSDEDEFRLRLATTGQVQKPHNHQHQQRQPPGHTGPRHHRPKGQHIPKGQHGPKGPEPPGGHPRPSPRRTEQVGLSMFVSLFFFFYSCYYGSYVFRLQGFHSHVSHDSSSHVHKDHKDVDQGCQIQIQSEAEN